MTSPEAPELVTRRLTTADVDLVLRHAEVFANEPTVEWTEDFLARGANVLLLAFEGDRPVASLVAVETANLDTSPDLFVYEIFVRPECRRRGVAHALLEKVVATAEDAGCSRVWAALTQGRDAGTPPAVHSASPPNGEPVEAETTSIVIPLD